MNSNESPMSQAIMEKYGEARLPRYTSYPTAPHFHEGVGDMDYRQWLEANSQGALSLYVHIPFLSLIHI